MPALVVAIAGKPQSSKTRAHAIPGIGHHEHRLSAVQPAQKLRFTLNAATPQDIAPFSIRRTAVIAKACVAITIR
jgi:hypothetical protein